MKKSLIYPFLVTLSISIVLFCQYTHVFAQENGQIRLSVPEVGNFPSIHFFMEVFNSDGDFITDLQPAEIKILENDEPNLVTGLERLEPGLQFILAVNTGPLMANHYVGIENYERIQEILKAWALSKPFETPDDFSMISNSGPITLHRTIPQEWVDAIDNYHPDFLSLQPELTSLNQALDMASDPTPKPNMKRAILYITPSLNNDQVDAIPAIAARASQLDVHVFVWMVATSNAVTSKSADALQDLADQTGGDFFIFTGAEQLPDPESHFESLRYIYSVTYNSDVNQGGEHRMAVQIERDDFQLTSGEQIFSITILPPNPIFLDPPVQILRTWSEPDNRKDPVLIPESIPIKTIVEFPDGKVRPITKATLYVDGVTHVELTNPPFEIIPWLLSEYNVNGSHLLQVKVEDGYGFTGASIQIPVEILVEAKPESVFSRERLIIGVSVLAAALILTMVVFLTGSRRNPFQRRIEAIREFNDPVTQPVASRHIPSRPRPVSNIEIPTSPRPSTRPIVPARLIRLSENGQVMLGNSIPLTHQETTLGSDPNQAIHVLDSPSVSSMHARIFRNTDGIFMLADTGSVAGTWLNYAPVSAKGARMKHGDVIHIGRVSFRFELTQASTAQNPQAAPFEGENL